MRDELMERRSLNKALDALDSLSDAWASEVNLVGICKNIAKASNLPAAIHAIALQAWVEGAYAGRTSHTLSTQQPEAGGAYYLGEQNGFGHRIAFPDGETLCYVGSQAQATDMLAKLNKCAAPKTEAGAAYDKAIADLRTVVGRRNEQQFSAIGYDASSDRRIIKECLRLAEGLRALYAAPNAGLPRDPTPEMFEAWIAQNHCIDRQVGRFTFSGDHGNWLACYHAMTAAAPKAETQELIAACEWALADAVDGQIRIPGTMKIRAALSAQRAEDKP